MITNGSSGDYDVLEIGTVTRAEADFSEPKLVPPEHPTSNSVRVTGELDSAEAAQVLGTRPLWLGPEFQGLKLAAVQKQEVTTGYGRDSGAPASRDHRDLADLRRGAPRAPDARLAGDHRVDHAVRHLGNLPTPAPRVTSASTASAWAT